MKLARVILLVTVAAGVVAVGLTLGGTNGSSLPEAGDVRSVASAADGVTKAQSHEAALLQSENLRDVNVPDNVKGFEGLVGTSERGANLLSQRLSCLRCHSIVPGEDTGYPNLSDVANRLSAKEIVTSILEPSRDFTEGYKSIMVVTIHGQMVQGVELDSNDQVVVLRTSRGEEEVRRDEIEKMTVAKSVMPEGLVDDLSPQEFADLLAFLSGLNRNEEAISAK